MSKDQDKGIGDQEESQVAPTSEPGAETTAIEKLEISSREEETQHEVSSEVSNSDDGEEDLVEESMELPALGDNASPMKQENK
mmetsp:Transcript_28227/g.47985  ORF Transcript_28227/g.47985 Transcript_28227/m.47985 type:complete len:83 (-) Transcript_28227:30-278(-)